MKVPEYAALKTLLQQGISDPVFYGEFINLDELLQSLILVFNLKRLNDIRVGYNMDIMRQSACLVINPITHDLKLWFPL